MNPDIAERCNCGYSFPASIAAKPIALAPHGVVLDLSVIVIAIAISCIAIWGIGKVASEFDQRFLFLLVILPWIWTLSFLLRRHCYPNTSIWRAGSISPLDPMPTPIRHKLYVTFLGGVQIVFGMLLGIPHEKWTRS